MSFSQEMKEFIAGFEAGERIQDRWSGRKMEKRKQDYYEKHTGGQHQLERDKFEWDKEKYRTHPGTGATTPQVEENAPPDRRPTGGSASADDADDNLMTASVGGGSRGGNVRGFVDLGDPLLSAAGYAIKQIESGGGNYGAIGKTTAKGDQALGAYQVMQSNLANWGQQVFGRPVTRQEFLGNPGMQDRMFSKIYGGYLQKYGPQRAPNAWFSGEGGMNNPAASDLNQMTNAKYSGLFNQHYQKGLQLAGAGGGDRETTQTPGQSAQPPYREPPPAQQPPSLEPQRGARTAGLDPSLTETEEADQRLLVNPNPDWSLGNTTRITLRQGGAIPRYAEGGGVSQEYLNERQEETPLLGGESNIVHRPIELARGGAIPRYQMGGWHGNIAGAPQMSPEDEQMRMQREQQAAMHMQRMKRMQDRQTGNPGVVPGQPPAEVYGNAPAGAGAAGAAGTDQGVRQAQASAAYNPNITAGNEAAAAQNAQWAPQRALPPPPAQGYRPMPPQAPGEFQTATGESMEQMAARQNAAQAQSQFVPPAGGGGSGFAQRFQGGAGMWGGRGGGWGGGAAGGGNEFKAPPAAGQTGEAKQGAPPKQPNMGGMSGGFGMFADGGPVGRDFDPEGEEYDYEGARAGGIKPDETGHYASRNPKDGMILKGRRHPTYRKTEEGEREAGHKIEKRGGRYYSMPMMAEGGAIPHYADGGGFQGGGYDPTAVTHREGRGFEDRMDVGSYFQEQEQPNPEEVLQARKRLDARAKEYTRTKVAKRKKEEEEGDADKPKKTSKPAEGEVAPEQRKGPLADRSPPDRPDTETTEASHLQRGPASQARAIPVPGAPGGPDDTNEASHLQRGPARPYPPEPEAEPAEHQRRGPLPDRMDLIPGEYAPPVQTDPKVTEDRVKQQRPKGKYKAPWDPANPKPGDPGEVKEPKQGNAPQSAIPVPSDEETQAMRPRGAPGPGAGIPSDEEAQVPRGGQTYVPPTDEETQAMRPRGGGVPAIPPPPTDEETQAGRPRGGRGISLQDEVQGPGITEDPDTELTTGSVGAGGGEKKPDAKADAETSKKILRTTKPSAETADKILRTSQKVIQQNPNKNPGQVLIENAASQEEAVAASKKSDPEQKLPLDLRNLKTIHDVQDYWYANGKTMLGDNQVMRIALYYRQRSMQLGHLAVVALKNGDMDVALQTLQQAHAYIPDGMTVDYRNAGEGNFVFRLIDSSSGQMTDWAEATPQAIMGMAQKATTGMAYFELMQAAASKRGGASGADIKKAKDEKEPKISEQQRERGEDDALWANRRAQLEDDLANEPDERKKAVIQSRLEKIDYDRAAENNAKLAKTAPDAKELNDYLDGVPDQLKSAVRQHAAELRRYNPQMNAEQAVSMVKQLIAKPEATKETVAPNKDKRRYDVRNFGPTYFTHDLLARIGNTSHDVAAATPR